MIEWFNNLSDANKIAIVIPGATAVISGLFGLVIWLFAKKGKSEKSRTNGGSNTAINAKDNSGNVAGGDIHIGINAEELKTILSSHLKTVGTNQSNNLASKVMKLSDEKLNTLTGFVKGNNTEQHLQLEKEFQLYGELWKALVDVRSSIIITPTLDRMPKEASLCDVYRDRCNIAIDAFNKAKNLFESNRPFYHDNVSRVTKEFLGRCRGYIFKVQRALDANKFDDRLHDEADELCGIIPKATDEIEKAIKIRIGLLPKSKIYNRFSIGPELGSIAGITNGSIIYNSNSLNFIPLIGLKMSIIGGYVKCNNFGKLEAYIQTDIPFQSLQYLNEQLGLDSMRLFSESGAISEDADNPVVFTSSTDHILPQGEKVLNLSTWKEELLPVNFHVQTQTMASGHLEGKVFRGKFEAILTYQEINFQIGLDGDFQVDLA